MSVRLGKTALVMALLLVGLPSSAWSRGVDLSGLETAGVSPHHWSAYVNRTSDYVYRGVSLSGRHPAWQGAVAYRHDNGVYGGWWLSTMDFAPPVGPDLEHNIYLGHGQRWSDEWRSDVSYTYFNFRGGKVGPDNAFTQWQLGVHYQERLTARVYYAQNSYGLDFASHAYELEVPLALSGSWSLRGLGGYWDLEHFVGKSYYYSDIGLCYQRRNFSASVHQHYAGKSGRETYGEAAESGWLLMMAVGF